MRTTRADLDELARIINTYLGTPGEYFVQYAYSQPRLFREDGAREVSPRLPAGQLALWMQAFIKGIDAGRRNA